MKKLFLYIVLVSLYVQYSFGYIYQIHVLQKYNHAAKKMQRVIMCGDYHNKVHLKTKDQKRYLQNLLNRVKRPCILLLEDLSSVNTAGKCSCEPYTINSRDGLLGAFQSGIHNALVYTKNLEYRYCQVC